MRPRLPHRATPEELESTLVGRQELAAQLVEDFRTTAQETAARYAVLLGERGEGKSHLLAVLAGRLARELQLTTVYLPTMRVDSLAGFLAAVLEAVPQHHSLPSPQRQLQQLWGLPAEEAARRALRMLDGRAGERGMVLVIDELERVLSSMRPHSLSQLRALLQERGRWSILGAARRLSGVFSDRSQPFFSTFSAHPLPALTLQDSIELLSKRGISAHPPWVVDYLKQTGGSPLAVVRLEEALARRRPGVDSSPLDEIAERLLGELMQAVDALPAGQQVAIAPLLQADHPMPVREIARRAFQTPQATSSHLRRIAGAGLLEATAEGRERLYQLVSPLFRFAVQQTRHAQTRDPARYTG